MMNNAPKGFIKTRLMWNCFGGIFRTRKSRKTFVVTTLVVILRAKETKAATTRCLRWKRGRIHIRRTTQLKLSGSRGTR